MHPLALLGGAIVLFLMFGDDKKTLINKNKAPGTAPGPGAQGARRNPAPGNLPQSMTQPQNAGGTSPNATLQTINGGVVLANNAMGLLGSLRDYVGSNGDSEYPVPDYNTPSQLGPDTMSPAPDPFDAYQADQDASSYG